MSRRLIPLAQADPLALCRRPVFLQCLLAAAMPLALSIWSALLNTFVVHVSGFLGGKINGLLDMREIPGRETWLSSGIALAAAE